MTERVILKKVGSAALRAVAAFGRVVFALLLAAALQGCGLLPPTAADRCRDAARAYASDNPAVVVASFDTSVGAIRRLERETQPPRWPARADSDPAVLCYIDAQIPKPPPGGEPFDRAVIAIVDGQPELIIAGYRDNLPITPP